MVVPQEDQFHGIDISQRFFAISMEKLFGTSERNARHVLSGLKAVSSMGNIIVVTFTAARGQTLSVYLPCYWKIMT